MEKMDNIYDEESNLPSETYIKEICSPSMNLLKTFDIFEPNYMDFLKDLQKNKWLDKYLDTVVCVLVETDKLARKNNFTSYQIAAVFEIFYSCFRYLVFFPKIELNKFLEYFRQTLLLYTVNDPPECLRIFNASQGFDVAKMFHEKFVVHYNRLIKTELLDV